MRFTEAVAGLTGRPLPDPLPPAPAALQPTATDRGGDRARPGPSWPTPTRASAVLVLLIPDAAGEARVVLTARPVAARRHAGEISFTGGALEPEDASAEAAALREAREEVGLDPAQAGVRLVGRLDEVAIGPSGFRLTPILALAARAPHLVADPVEVAAILTPPLAAFLPGAPIARRQLQRDGWILHFGAYIVEGRVIWGATARVLGQLGALLRPESDPRAAR